MKQGIFILLLIFILASAVGAKTYPIIEQDMGEAAENYSKTEDFKNKVKDGIAKKRDEIINYSGILLPKALDNGSYYVSYSYTLPQDIPRVDREGNITGILYPKGYTFKPLLYLAQAPPPMLVFNPCDKSEKDFVDRYLVQQGLYNRMLISSGCPLKDIKGYSEFVYPLDKRMIDRFNLKSTVSIVSVDIQQGVFYVQVFKTDNSK